MDPAEVRSYRPVLSKLLERLVARQLLAHLNSAGLMPRLICVPGLPLDGDGHVEG